MKLKTAKLVYFSPAGTTKKIVEAIARGIDHSLTEIADITKPEGRKKQLQTGEDELLVIGVPVYFGRLQANAAEWLNTIKARNTPTICVVVYGNREYEDALLELKDTVVNVGGLPVACAAFIGQHSFSSSETPIAAGRPDGDDLSRARLFGQKIREKMLSVPSINHIAEVGVPGKYPYKDVTGIKKMLSSTASMAVDGSCSQCGLCEHYCPVGAIAVGNNVSIDTTKCILCNACIKICPENALKINSDMIKKIALQLSQTCEARKGPTYFL